MHFNCNCYYDESASVCVMSRIFPGSAHHFCKKNNILDIKFSSESVLALDGCRGRVLFSPIVHVSVNNLPLQLLQTALTKPSGTHTERSHEGRRGTYWKEGFQQERAGMRGQQERKWPKFTIFMFKPWTNKKWASWKNSTRSKSFLRMHRKGI